MPSDPRHVSFAYDWAGGQYVAYTATAAQSAALEANTLYYFSPTTACYIKGGSSNPTATVGAGSIYVAAKTVFQFYNKTAGDKISVVRSTADGVFTLLAAGPSLATETNTLAAAFTTVPSAMRLGTINTLIKQLKAAGVWDTLDVLHVYAAADAQAASLNWKNPSTYTAVPVLAPTFLADRGYTGNGTTQYINTTYNPAAGTNFVQDSANLMVWDQTATHAGIDKYLCGVAKTTTTNQVAIKSRHTDDLFYGGVNSPLTDTAASTNSHGMFMANRTGAALNSLSRNGSVLGSPNSTSTAIPSGNIFVMGYNELDTAAVTKPTADQISAFSAGGSLTTAQLLAYYNAMYLYMTSVGAE